jgi:mRNA interferase MazF
MNRGEVYDARLEPVEGSEQGGTRPVIIVSRATINTYSPVVWLFPALLIKLVNEFIPLRY